MKRFSPISIGVPVVLSLLTVGFDSGRSNAEESPANPMATIPSVSSLAAEPRANPMAQVTSVNQLRDVSPTSWAY
ncbi:hypothetical protein, partial [Arcanobacterium phocae]